MSKRGLRPFELAFLATIAVFPSLGNAANYTGKVSLLEVWPNGNVAFSLTGVAGPGLPCNGQVVVNKSVPGVKNMYAALLAAKHTGKQVTVVSSSCGPADDYSPSVLYNIVDYLDVLDY